VECNFCLYYFGHLSAKEKKKRYLSLKVNLSLGNISALFKGMLENDAILRKYLACKEDAEETVWLNPNRLYNSAYAI
jgi:hypothetical protein